MPTDPNAFLYLFFEPIAPFLDDPDVSEIMINGPDRIYVERRGRIESTNACFCSENALRAAAMNVARSVGRMLGEENPILEARLPDGSRLEAVIPPLSRTGTVVSIRKFRKEKLTPAELVRFGSISEGGVRLIETIVRLHKNLVVSGATSSGKTSVLNVLSGIIDPGERILVIEDASELQLQQPHTVRFETRKPDKDGKGEVTIRDLLIAALRLRPDRLVIGEVRGGEALDLLEALNTGHAGSMSTIHANTPLDTLSRLETCTLLSGIDIPMPAVRAMVAGAIGVIIQTARLSDGSRKITHISEVLGLEEGVYKMQDIYVFRPEGLAPDGKVAGHHVFTGATPRFAEEARRLNLPEPWADERA
ncbi:MAG: CpaF family protein [Lentisphaerae bacterium]|nr:CpaF family protein [Lentisphaerota bacterium]